MKKKIFLYPLILPLLLIAVQIVTAYILHAANGDQHWTTQLSSMAYLFYIIIIFCSIFALIVYPAVCLKYGKNILSNMRLANKFILSAYVAFIETLSFFAVWISLPILTPVVFLWLFLWALLPALLYKSSSAAVSEEIRP